MSNSNSESDINEEKWDDWELEEEEFGETKCLCCSMHFPTANSTLLHCKGIYIYICTLCIYMYIYVCV